MATCVALLCGPLDHKLMGHWLSTDLFQEHILHVEVLSGIDVAGGQLSADPFVIPDAIDLRDIAGLALVDAETRQVLSYGFQVPALGISCLKDQNVLCLRGWCEEPPTVEEYESDCSMLDDPCALYRELRCCLLKLVKEQECISVTLKDRTTKFQPRSEADKVRLERMMMEAKIACEGCAGTSRGGHLGHSCHRPMPRYRGGCC